MAQPSSMDGQALAVGTTTILFLPQSELVAIAAAVGQRAWRAALRASCSTLWRLGGEATLTLRVPYEDCELAARTCANTFPRATSLIVMFGDTRAWPVKDAVCDGLLLLLDSTAKAAAPPKQDYSEGALGLMGYAIRSSTTLGSRLTTLDLSTSAIDLPTALAAISCCLQLVTLYAPRLLSAAGRRLCPYEFHTFLAALLAPRATYTMDRTAAAGNRAGAAMSLIAKTSLGLPKLRNLSLAAAAESIVSAKHLIGLELLTNLESLTLTLCTASPIEGTAVLALVRHLKHLTELVYDGPTAGHGGGAWVQLAELPRLQRLRGLHEISTLPSLHGLCGWALHTLEMPTSVLHQGDVYILSCCCPFLESLACWSLHSKPASTTSSTAAGEATLPQVRCLDVVRMSARCFPPINVTFPALQELRTTVGNLPPAVLEPFAPTLTALRLQARQPSLNVWRIIQQAGMLSLSRLGTLVVECTGGLPCEALLTIASSCAQLKVLRLAPAGNALCGYSQASVNSSWPWLSCSAAGQDGREEPQDGFGVPPAPSQVTLQEPILKHPCIASALVAALPCLQNLEVEGAQGLDAAGVAALAAAPSLARLVLVRCPAVTGVQCMQVLAQVARPYLDMQWEELPLHLGA